MVSALQRTYEQGSIGISVACVPDEAAQGKKTNFVLSCGRNPQDFVVPYPTYVGYTDPTRALQFPSLRVC